MQIDSRHVPFNFSAPYFSLHPPGAHTRSLWIACHGYGQLAERFIRRFDALDETHFVIAPQGLSRFYVKPWEEVGASWMTREDMATEIANQHAYLDAVWNEARSAIHSEVQVILFGFSQGVATIARWLAARKVPYCGLVIWAGSLPSELKPGSLQSSRPDAQVWLVAGRSDPFLEMNKLESSRRRVSALAGAFQELWFDGSHEVTREEIRQLAQSLTLA